MSYTSMSFVAFEQPSLSKWQQLNTNDSYFNTQIGSNFSSGTTSTVWWEELGRTTLGGTADTVSVTPIATRKYLKVLISVIQSGSIDILMRFNNDTSNNYAGRYSGNNAADTTFNTSGALVIASAETSDRYAEVSIINISAKEKLMTGSAISFGTAGVANSPTRWDTTGKWVNTSSQITRIDIVNFQAGDFGSGSQMIVLGHD